MLCNVRDIVRARDREQFERGKTMRQLKREVKIGNVTIGGKNPIAVQTMLNVPVEDIEGMWRRQSAVKRQAVRFLRVTCPSAADAKACIEAVKNAVKYPHRGRRPLRLQGCHCLRRWRG